MSSPAASTRPDLPVDRERLGEICARDGVAELYVFGSTARGEATESSDVDLLYVLTPGASLGFAIDDREDELSRTFTRRVDLVSKRALHPLLRDAVLTEARPLHASVTAFFSPRSSRPPVASSI